MHSSPLGLADQAKRYLVATALAMAGVVALFILWKATGVLILIFAGVLVSLLLQRLSSLVSDWTRLPRKLSLGLVILLLLGTCALVLWWLMPRVESQIVDLANRLPESMQSLSDRLATMPWGKKIVSRIREALDFDYLSSYLGQAAGLFSSTIGVGVSLLTMLIVSVYTALEPEVYVSGLILLVPKDKQPKARRVLHEMAVALRRWFAGRLVAMAAVGLLTWLGLWFLSVPLAVSLGIIAGFLNFIPNFGPALSALPAILLGLESGLSKAAYVAGLYLIVQYLENWAITPIVQRHAVSMPPVLLISSQLVLGFALGLPGLIFATPITLAALVLVKMLYVEEGLGKQVDLPGAD